MRISYSIFEQLLYHTTLPYIKPDKCFHFLLLKLFQTQFTVTVFFCLNEIIIFFSFLLLLIQEFPRGIAINLKLISCTQQPYFLDCDEEIPRHSPVGKMSPSWDSNRHPLKRKPNDLPMSRMIIHNYIFLSKEKK